ncbi:MAG: hypothetical protein H7831_06875 [Magnetococcus sp. WYHC-3]
MAELILKNVKMYVDGHDLTGDMNEVTLTEKVDILDKTVFGSNSRRRLAGLRDVEFSAGGFWNSSEGNEGTTSHKIDPVAFTRMGSSMSAVSILPNGTGLGDVSYTVPGCLSEYTPGGSIGDMFGYTITGYGINALARGKLVMRGIVSTNWGGANTSTGQNIGVATTQRKIITGIHVLATSQAASGAKIGIKIQASTDSAFGGTPKTLYGTTLTTGLSGKSVYLTTKNPTTSYSYVRAKTSQNGTSTKRFKVILTVGHQKGR